MRIGYAYNHKIMKFIGCAFGSSRCTTVIIQPVTMRYIRTKEYLRIQKKSSFVGLFFITFSKLY